MRRRSDDGRATTYTPSASAGTEAAFTAADAGGNDLPRDNHAVLATDSIIRFPCDRDNPFPTCPKRKTRDNPPHCQWQILRGE